MSCDPGPNPPTNLGVVQDSPGSLSYTFSWEPSTVRPFSRAVVSYTLSCEPSLTGVDSSVSHTLNNSTISASLSLAHGLSYTCCVWATSDGGVAPSNRTCLASPLATPPAGEETHTHFSSLSLSLSLSLCRADWSPTESGGGPRSQKPLSLLVTSRALTPQWRHHQLQCHLLLCLVL